MTKGNIKRLVTILLVIGIVVFLSLIIYANVFHLYYCMNSDIAAEGLLGEWIWKTKQWIPDTWYPSTETRIIATPNIDALIYGLTQNISLSMSLSSVTMTLLIVGSTYFFAGAFDWSRTKKLLLVFLVLVIPSSIYSLELLYLYACYYAIHIIILFCTLRTFVDLHNGKKGWKPHLLICLILSFLIGLQGVRGLLVIYGPLFVVLFFRILYCKLIVHENGLRELKMVFWGLVLIVLSFLGTRFPFSTGQSPSKNIRAGFSKLVQVVIPDIAESIGIGYTSKLGEICIVILLLIALFCFIRILVKFFKKQEVSDLEWVFLALCASPVMTAFAVAFTTMESSERYYFILIFTMAVGIMLFIGYVDRKLVCVAFATIVLLGAVNIQNVYMPIFTQDEYLSSDLYRTVEYLINHQYDTAYTTFDYANTMTVLANGQLRVHPVNSMEKLDICKWLTDSMGYTPYGMRKQRTAYIVTEEHQQEMENLATRKNGTIVKKNRIGDFIIYVSDYNFAVGAQN